MNPTAVLVVLLLGVSVVCFVVICANAYLKQQLEQAKKLARDRAGQITMYTNALDHERNVNGNLQARLSNMRVPVGVPNGIPESEELHFRRLLEIAGHTQCERCAEFLEHLYGRGMPSSFKPTPSFPPGSASPY